MLPQSIRRNDAMQRLAGEPAQAVKYGAFSETHAKLGQQRRDPAGFRPLALPLRELPPEIEERDRVVRDVLRELGRVPDDLEHVR